MFKNEYERPDTPNGEVLREDYLKSMEMSANALANQLHVPASRINDSRARTARHHFCRYGIAFKPLFWW